MTTYRDRLIAGIHRSPESTEELNIEQLKAALRALDQPLGGTKNELEKRLANAQKNA